MSEDYTKIVDMENTKQPSDITPTEDDPLLGYKKYRDYVRSWFSQQDYECRLAFEEAWGSMVSEDYDGIDIILNLTDLVFEHCHSNNKKLSLSDKRNLKQLRDGIQHIVRSMKQYSNTDTDKILIATLAGYMLKVTRNFYHD